MNTKHSEGPWSLTDHGDRRHREFAIMAEGGKVASVFAGFGHHFTFEQAEANARLIAAAPALLEALKAMVCMMDKGPQPKKFDDAITWRENDDKARAMADAAIAKATD